MELNWNITANDVILRCWYCCRFRPVGMPHTERVMVHNLDAHGSLHLLSISGSTSHFHCSFFLEKVCRKFIMVTQWNSSSSVYITRRGFAAWSLVVMCEFQCCWLW